MDFSILLPAGDRDTWSTGIVLVCLWAYWLTMSVTFPLKRRKWLKKNPSASAKIDAIFFAFARGRFSNVGKLTYAVWLALGLAWVAEGYLEKATCAGLIAMTALVLIPTALFVTGLHFCINARFLNLLPVINHAAANKYDVTQLRDMTSTDLFIFRSMGVGLMGLSIFLISCGLLSFPCSLSQLTTMMDK